MTVIAERSLKEFIEVFVKQHPEVEKVIVNGPATIVILVGGQKGIALRGKNEPRDQRRNAVAIAYYRAMIEYAKYAINDNNNIFKKALKNAKSHTEKFMDKVESEIEYAPDENGKIDLKGELVED